MAETSTRTVESKEHPTSTPALLTAQNAATLPAKKTDKTSRKMGKGPVWIPILNRHGVSIFCVAGDGYRFADLFFQTWKQIPLRNRRQLLKMWRQTRPTTLDLPWPPIELVPGKSDYSRGNSSAAVAQYNPFFKSFSFDSRYMDMLSDSSVQAIIAHELAHAVLVVEDPQYHLGNVEYDGCGFSQAEYDADELAEFWGFDPEPRIKELSELPVLNCVA